MVRSQACYWAKLNKEVQPAPSSTHTPPTPAHGREGRARSLEESHWHGRTGLPRCHLIHRGVLQRGGSHFPHPLLLLIYVCFQRTFCLPHSLPFQYRRQPSTFQLITKGNTFLFYYLVYKRLYPLLFHSPPIGLPLRRFTFTSCPAAKTGSESGFM